VPRCDFHANLYDPRVQETLKGTRVVQPNHHYRSDSVSCFQWHQGRLTDPLDEGDSDRTVGLAVHGKFPGKGHTSFDVSQSAKQTDERVVYGSVRTELAATVRAGHNAPPFLSGVFPTFWESWGG